MQQYADIYLLQRNSTFISVYNQLNAQNLFHNKFYFMPLHLSSTCAHHLRSKLHYTASGIITPIGGRLVTCSSSWLLRCTVSKMSKSLYMFRVSQHPSSGVLKCPEESFRLWCVIVCFLETW